MYSEQDTRTEFVSDPVHIAFIDQHDQIREICVATRPIGISINSDGRVVATEHAEVEQGWLVHKINGADFTVRALFRHLSSLPFEADVEENTVLPVVRLAQELEIDVSTNLSESSSSSVSNCSSSNLLSSTYEWMPNSLSNDSSPIHTPVVGIDLFEPKEFFNTRSPTTYRSKIKGPSLEITKRLMMRSQNVTNELSSPFAFDPSLFLDEDRFKYIPPDERNPVKKLVAAPTFLSEDDFPPLNTIASRDWPIRGSRGSTRTSSRSPGRRDRDSSCGSTLSKSASKDSLSKPASVQATDDVHTRSDHGHFSLTSYVSALFGFGTILEDPQEHD